MFYEPYFADKKGVCRPATNNDGTPCGYTSREKAMKQIRTKATPTDAAFVILQKMGSGQITLAYEAGALPGNISVLSGICCIPLDDPTKDRRFWESHGWLIGKPTLSENGNKWPMLLREAATAIDMTTRVVEDPETNERVYIITGHGREGRGETPEAAMHDIMGVNKVTQIF